MGPEVAEQAAPRTPGPPEPFAPGELAGNPRAIPAGEGPRAVRPPEPVAAREPSEARERFLSVERGAEAGHPTRERETGEEVDLEGNPAAAAVVAGERLVEPVEPEVSERAGDSGFWNTSD